MRIANLVVAASMVVTPVTVTYSSTVGAAPAEQTFTHHCHEDEAQVVTPQGLACVPVDNITDLRPEQFDGMRVLGDEYNFDRP